MTSISAHGATMAQTYSRGPLTTNGSGKALTAAEMDVVRLELAELVAKVLKEPVRGFMDDPKATRWRFSGPPDYSLTNVQYLQGRTKMHAEGSLEQIVENLVKTWCAHALTRARGLADVFPDAGGLTPNPHP